jgi:hypothetical protein
MRATHTSPLNTYSEFSPSQKPVLIQALTTTHTVVDAPSHRLMNSESGHDLALALPQERGLDKYSAYSLSSVNLDGKGGIPEETGAEEESTGECV